MFPLRKEITMFVRPSMNKDQPRVLVMAVWPTFFSLFVFKIKLFFHFSPHFSLLSYFSAVFPHPGYSICVTSLREKVHT